MKNLHQVTYLLMAVGAINWGLVGLFNINLVGVLLGSWPMVEKLVYVLVGLSGAYDVSIHMKSCKICGSKK